MTQPALFDLTPFNGPADDLGRARALLALVENLGSDAEDPFWDDPAAWDRGLARARAMAAEFNATKLLNALNMLADPDALTMLGPDQLEIEAERRAREIVERLEHDRLVHLQFGRV